MKTSFKEKLNNLIKSRFPESVSINEIEQFCKQERKKLSNAERRLRISESPDVLRIYNNAPGKNRAIVGYVWSGGENIGHGIIELNDNGIKKIKEDLERIKQVKQAFADFEAKQNKLL